MLFAAGLALAVLPLVSPLDAAGDDYLLSAHMLQHVLIGDAAAVLLVLAVRGPLVFFLLPGVLLKRLAAVRPLRSALGLLLRPRVSFTLWVVIILGWHIPTLYDAALRHESVHVVEHVCFVVVGVLVWTQLIDPAHHSRLSERGRVAFALGLLIASQPIVVAFISSPRVLYTPYAEQHARLFGLGALTDQRWAGAVMMIEQVLTVGVFVLLQLRPLLRRSAAVAQGRV